MIGSTDGHTSLSSIDDNNLWATNTCATADEPVYDPLYTGPCVSVPPVADFQVATSLTVCENNPTIAFEDLSQFLPTLTNGTDFDTQYKESWNFIKENINSLNRYTNVPLLLDFIKSLISKET